MYGQVAKFKLYDKNQYTHCCLPAPFMLFLSEGDTLCGGWWVCHLCTLLSCSLYNDTDTPSFGSGGLVAMVELMAFNFPAWVIQGNTGQNSLCLVLLRCSLGTQLPHCEEAKQSHRRLHAVLQPCPWLAVSSHHHVWDAEELQGF